MGLRTALILLIFLTMNNIVITHQSVAEMLKYVTRTAQAVTHPASQTSFCLN